MIYEVVVLYFTYIYTGWPRKNATTFIVNFMNIVDETELFFILFGRTFIFQQNDTMIISCLDCSAILVRQCNFQNLVLFQPNWPLEHRKTLDPRRPVLLKKPSHWKQRQCEQTGLFITQHLTPWSKKFLLFQRSRGSKK